PRAPLRRTGDTVLMAPTLTWIVVALVVALVVLVVAGTTSGAPRRGVRDFLRDLRAGVRPDPGDSVGLLSSARQELAEAADAEGSLEDIFRIGEAPPSAYVEPAELVGPLAGAARRLRGH